MTITVTISLLFLFSATIPIGGIPMKRALMIDSSEWPIRGFGTRVQRMHGNEMWNYDPFWYDLLSRPEMRKRSEQSSEGTGQEGGEMGKRLFVARIGKRMAHVYRARVG